jgi:cytidine deaminase
VPSKKEINIQYSYYNSLSELSDEERSLITSSENAILSAYAPYSNFRVGAAVLLEDGTIVTGSNQENAAYPSGLCAERVAFFAAGAHHPGKKIKAVAVIAKSENINKDEPVSPCGGCRQVMTEYEFKQNSPIEILLSSPSGKVIKIDSVKKLLPLVFEGSVLKNP